MTARIIAARALGRVLRGGAYSNVLLAGLGEAEHGPMVQALVMHALRTIGLANATIEAGASRPLSKLDDAVVDVLRIAIGELDRGSTPDAIVVSEAVETAKGVGSGRAAGFVNAVLRSALRAGLPPLGPEDRLGVPDWLRVRVASAWGGQEATRFWDASARPARVGLRGVPAPGAPVDAVEGIPGTFLADSPVPGMVVQDPASTAVALATGARPGERVLDLAAAPGGKTAVLLDLVGPGGEVIAGDIHPRRLRSAARRVPNARWVRMDAALAPFGQASFDRVLLDAPCSGLGTLRRRPEILHRVTEAEVERLGSTQRRALKAAVTLLRPGGRLVYSVCTVLPEETTDQTDPMGMAPADGFGLGRREGSGWLFGPHLGPTDGMFLSILDR